MVTVQVIPDTESHPLHPVKMRPPVALRVTTVSMAYASVQSVPQSTPDGLELTLPPRRPLVLTVRMKRCGSNVAVTVLAALMVTVHVVPETLSQPIQPKKVEPLAGVAVSVTLVPPS